MWLNKKSLLIVALGLSSFSAWTQSTSTTKIKRKSSFNIPLTFELTNQNYSNINSLNNYDGERVNTQKLLVKSKLKFRPFAKTVLIDIPQASLEYSQDLENSVRNYSISNDLIGLYFLSRETMLFGSISAGSLKDTSNNEDQQLETNEYIYLSGDVGLERTINKKWRVEVSANSQIQDYLAPSTTDVDEENDNLRFGGKISNRYTLNKRIENRINLKTTRKYFREKRSLLSSGQLGSNAAETIHTSVIETGLRVRLKNGFSLQPKYGFKINEDVRTGGRSYRGPEMMVKLGYGNKNLKFSQRFGYKVRDYDSQLVNVNVPEDVNLAVRIFTLNTSVDVFNLFDKRATLLIGHEFTNTDSNRETDKSNGHVIKAGLRFKI